jgi:type I restriction enzyme S subunit
LKEPAVWRAVRIGDLGRVVTGSTPGAADHDRFFGSLPFITPTDLEANRRTPHITRFVSDVARSQLSKRTVPPRSVCFTCIGATIGKACLTDATSLTNQQINTIVVDRHNYDPAFVYYRLVADREAIRATASGAATPIISKSAFENMRVRTPPLSTQRKIAAMLSAYDDLIENNNRRIKILEEMAQRIYREWFVEFRYPGHHDMPMVAAQLGVAPEGWPMGTLEDLIVLQRGFDLPSKHRESGSVPVIAATGQHGSHSSAKVSGPGVLTGRSGSLGHVEYVPGDFWPLNTTLWVREFRRATPEFAFYMLQDLDLAQYNSGAAVPTLNRNDIKNLLRRLPPPDLVRTFSDVAKNGLDLQRHYQRTNDIARGARDLLLPRLVSGEVDVENLDIAVPELAA